jgi:hypothetical protein
MFEFIGGLSTGILLLLGYMVHRMMKNKGWDDSNVINALRLIAHVVLHPEDFGKMFYINGPVKHMLAHYGKDEEILQRPFWYVSKDELSEIVETRP